MHNIIDKKMLSTEKAHGRYYTPDYIVDNILDLSGYTTSAILKKHIIDNSCGDGAFLVKIVSRYCKIALKNKLSPIQIANDLSNYIHGIEIDKNECNKCINNVNNVIKKYNIPEITWDINCQNTLASTKYNGLMDYVIGNPPYIRVHNLSDSLSKIKKYSFSKSGMTDLYLVFFEIGIKMLNKNGILGYITPSSYFNSVAGNYMRKYFVENNYIDKIVDLKHYQAFKATTYTTITILKKHKPNISIEYFEFDEKNKIPVYVDTLKPIDFFIAGNFYFSEKRNLTELKNILNFKSQTEYFSVKNGFATLNDKFFIGKFNFKKYVIPIIKASTGEKRECFFPYDKNGQIITIEELSKDHNIKNYIFSAEKQLKSRSLENEENWHGFGRTQGLKDVYKQKYSINSLVKNIKDIKLLNCKPGVGVYSGLYILTNIEEEILNELILSESFISYIKMLSKYKSGGYYTYSSKDLKQFLEYNYSQRRKIKNEQFTIFRCT